MHNTAKALEKFDLYVNNQFFNNNNFTEALLFFPYHGKSCNFSSISFILGLIFT